MHYRRKLYRSPLYLVTMMLMLLAFATMAFGQEESNSDRVDGTRVLLEKWVETRRLISKEKQDWALGAELLGERVDLVQQEIDSFKKRISEAEKSLSGLAKNKVDLSTKVKTLDEASKVLEDSVGPLEKRVSALIAQVPEPLQEKVSPLSRRFAKPELASKGSLSERFQNVIGVLVATNKFNGEVSVASEVRDMGDGTTAEVTALYLGISQGYYANGPGSAGGIGTSSEGKWAWSPKNDFAKEISTAIKILNNEEVAGYVLLPLVIK
jgi:septal ring factor EnvC (AmiA/AmiB activator)